VLQCLSDVKGIQIFVMAELWLLPIRFSRFVHKFSFFPPNNDPEKWIERVNEQTLRHSIDVILPMYVTASRHLIEFREKLAKPEALLLPPNLEAFDTANNKGALADFLKKHGIPEPEFWHLEPDSREQKVSEMGPYPVMLKPTLDSGAGKGIKRFDTPDELADFLRATPLKSPCFVQQCIDGDDMGCHVLCKDGQILAYVMQKGFLFSRKAFTPQVGMELIFEEAVYQQVRSLMKNLNWSGLADLDLRLERNSGEFMILEINPRPWLTILGSNVAGVNFPWLYCQTVLGLHFDVPQYQRTSYHTWQGLRIALLKNPGMLFRWKYIWNNTPVRYMFRDPIVTFLEFIRIFLRFLKASFRSLTGHIDHLRNRRLAQALFRSTN